jgi:hypothetical protein
MSSSALSPSTGKRVKYPFSVVLALLPALLLIFLARQYQYELDPYLRVFNLLGTLLHEMGHSIAAKMTGGFVEDMVVRTNGSGYAEIGNGNPFIFYPAGYLSTTLVTAFMFFVNNRTRFGELILAVMGIAALVLTWQHGAPEENGNYTTQVVGYVSAAVLLYIGFHPNIRIPGTNRQITWWAPATMFLVNLIALYIGLGGMLSLQNIAQYTGVGDHNDVAMFTQLYASWMPPGVMAMIWLGLSLLVWLLVLCAPVYSVLKKKEE